MKTHVWTWICAGLATGLMALVAAGNLNRGAGMLAPQAPWPATAEPAASGTATTTTPTGAHSPQSGGGVALPTPSAAPTLSGQLAITAPEARVTAAHWQAGMVTITFTVQAMTGDCLFENPVLQVGGQSLLANPASLKTARLALLSLAAGGEARASLRFEGAPASGDGRLIFNPGSPALAVSPVAPRTELSVTWPLTATATPRRP